jgi:hypothetical protein
MGLLDNFVNRWRQQDFDPSDSVIASSINHPMIAALKARNWLDEKVKNASGQLSDEQLADNPNPLYGANQAQQIQAGLDLAGLLQTSAIPFAPKSSGGILGTIRVIKNGKTGKLVNAALDRAEYAGEHKAPLKDSGAPLSNLTANDNAIYPDDVYSPRASQYYGTGELEDARVFALARSLKGRPNAQVTAYRAVPDENYDISKQIKELTKIAQYKQKLGFFPNDNNIVDELYYKHNIDGVSYDNAQQNMLDEIYKKIEELGSQKRPGLKINHGDWVAIDRQYAKEHGESALNGKYKILSKKVPARQLFTNGDSIREWGWDSTASLLAPMSMMGLLGNYRDDYQ